MSCPPEADMVERMRHLRSCGGGQLTTDSLLRGPESAVKFLRTSLCGPRVGERRTD